MSYKPDHKGFKELATAAFVQDACVDAARDIEMSAGAIDPDGSYSTTPATVTAGSRNEKRGGASVTDDTGTRTGWKEESLKSAIRQNTEMA